MFSLGGQMKGALQEPLTGAPGQQQMGKYWEGNTDDPMKVLSMITAVTIEEKVKGMELFTGFETGNKYLIRDISQGSKNFGCDLFLAAEMNDGMYGNIARNATSGQNRPFNVKIGMLTKDGVPPQRFATLERPYKCTCCCLQRPTTVFKNSRTGATLGGVIEPFAPCKMKLTQFDTTGQPAGEVNECCTLMCCFGCPCKQEVSFPIKKDGATLATIKKRFTAMNAVGALTGLATDTDNFTIHFEDPKMTPEDKLHAISTVLMMDFAYFTKGGAQQRGGSGAAGIGGLIGGEQGAALGGLIGFAVGAATQASRPQQVEW